jgi:hypothetical protein
MADEYTSGGTVYYRISDSKYDTNNVQDTTLFTAFGDLSAGNEPILQVKSGIDSTISILDFVVRKRPQYGDQNAPLVGYDLNIVTSENSTYVGQDDKMQGFAALPITDIYMIKPEEQIEYEGNVNRVDDQGTTITYAINNNNNWSQANVAAFLAHSTYEDTCFSLYEDFNGSSDISEYLYKYTSNGKVFAGRKPYITVKDAEEYLAGFGNNLRKTIQTQDVSRMELEGFYGTDLGDGSGEYVIFIEPKDDDTVPPEKWRAAVKKGNEFDLLRHHYLTGSVEGAPEGSFISDYTDPIMESGMGKAAAVSAGAAGFASGTIGAAYLASPSTTATFGSLLPSVPGMGAVGTNAGPYIANNAGTGRVTGMYAQAKWSTMGNLSKFGARVRPLAGLATKGNIAMAVATTIAMPAYGEANRVRAIRHAQQTGDFSGLNRPASEPVWKHKDIKDKIKYADQYEEFTLTERDETGVTITSSWWDRVKEVKDYPKLATGSGQDSATSQTYGSEEEMLAKSSINFSAENSFDGGNMRMSCYHDVDLSYHPNKQLDFNFGASNKMQQDIYCSKFNLPAPARFFQSDDHNNPSFSAANKHAPEKYEISFTMNITDLAKGYSIGTNDGTVTVVQDHERVFRRGIALTFSNKKPQENESFGDYIQRHGPTNNGSAWSSDITGFVIENYQDIGTPASEKGVQLVPIAGILDNSGEKIQHYLRESATHTDELRIAYPSKEVPLPTSTWLRFKLTTDPHGSSGEVQRRHGRFYLTVEHANKNENGELIEAMREGGSLEGPLCLASPKDAATGNAYTNAHGDIDAPLSLDHWLQHMTLWVCNIRAMNGGGYNEAGTALAATHYHDSLAAGSLAVTQTVDESASNASTAFAPYTLAKTAVHIDEFKITGAQPKLVNMSVNDVARANSVRENIFNVRNRQIIEPAHKPYFDSDRGTHSTGASVKTEDSAPTVLAIGLKDTTNLAGASDGSPKFLLFNDFLSTDGLANPSAFLDSQMLAGYQDNSVNRMGDWVDVRSKLTKDTGFDTSGATGTGTSFTADADASSAIFAGDILKIGSEYMEVTSVSGATINVNRAIESADSATSHSNNTDIYFAGRSLFDNLTIGSGASNDIITSANEGDAYDSLQGSGYRAYVEGFSQKGFLQFENALSNWTRRECIYASTRITSLGSHNDGPDGGGKIGPYTAEITVADRAAVLFDEDEKYIIYKYGLEFGTSGATAFDINSGTAAIVTVLERDGNVIKVNMDQSSDWGGGSTKRGRELNELLTEANLPLLFICPFRYWLCINIDAMGGIDAANGNFSSELTDHAERGYGSIIPVGAPSSGYELGVTYNERKFFVNSSDQTHYALRRSFDIKENHDAVPYELGVDFGFGAYNKDTAMGGQVHTFIPQFGTNRINLDQLKAASLQEGSILSLMLSANGASKQNSMMTFFSGDVDYSAHSTISQAEVPKVIPQLAVKYFDPSPVGPGLSVGPAEGNELYPLYTINTADNDLWYGYLMVDSQNILDKYHNIVAYSPLNENVDNQPWLAKRTHLRGGSADTWRQVKMYGDQASVGQERIGSTQFKVSYATTNGAYNGTIQSSRPTGTMEGLGGRAMDTRDGGALLIKDQCNTLTTVAGKQASVVVHLISAVDEADGTILEVDPTSGNPSILIECTSGKVVATVYDDDGAGNAVTVTSLSSLPEDGETPTCIILTVDCEIPEANIKLYINGALEATSGNLAATATSSNWEFDRRIRTSASPTLKVGEYGGIYEEIIIYKHIIYPFEFSNGSQIQIPVTKNFEEIAENTNGRPLIYNARAFVFDYHNLRGDVCGTSSQVSFKKTAFEIDGT